MDQIGGKAGIATGSLPPPRHIPTLPKLPVRGVCLPRPELGVFRTYFGCARKVWVYPEGDIAAHQVAVLS